MNVMAGTLLVLVLIAQSAVGKVESTFDKKVNFQSLRTYSWIRGYDAYNPEVHKLIIAALEEEMTRLGFTKATSNPDVTLAYYTVLSSEIDLKALDKLPPPDRANAPMKSLGRLLVIMRNPRDEARLWSVSSREYVDADVAKFPETIRNVAKRLFDAYPGRKSGQGQ